MAHMRDYRGMCDIGMMPIPLVVVSSVVLILGNAIK